MRNRLYVLGCGWCGLIISSQSIVVLVRMVYSVGPLDWHNFCAFVDGEAEFNAKKGTRGAAIISITAADS